MTLSIPNLSVAPVSMPIKSVSSDSSAGRGTGDLVYTGLKDRILSHELHHGAPLREDEVAGWFQASRVPAREALRKLDQEGLVERVGRSYAVRRFTLGEIVVIYRQRAALEHLAAEIAVSRMADEDPQVLFGGLREILEQQLLAAQHASRAEFSRLDRAFHMAIAELSREELLMRELDIILARVQLIRTAEISRDAGAIGAYEDHCRIYNALLRGDVRTVKAELDYHFHTTVRLHRSAEGAPASQDLKNAQLRR